MADKSKDAGHGRLSKEEGSFYTPTAVAEAIAKLSGLVDEADAASQIMDPAAGDGALLVAAMEPLVRRLHETGADAEDIPSLLTTNIHAIELDATEAGKCRESLSAEACRLTGQTVPTGEWDVVVGDTCREWEAYAGRMDFVLMNPPYVRIHNMADRPDSPYVTGMCDLYYAFFDYAQRMLSPGGRLSAIAPSSWMTAKAGDVMRRDLMSRGVVRAVCDYGHLQVFAPYATTYTALVLIGTDEANTVRLWGHDDHGTLTEPDEVAQDGCWHDGLFMPVAPAEMDDMLHASGGGVSVRNGYATNLDRFFMSDASRFGACEIPVVKASRAKVMVGVYPYDEGGKLLPFDVIREMSPSLVDAYETERDALLRRTQVPSDGWWCYARSQGIADTYHDKVAVQSLMVPGTPPRTTDAPAGTGVFGGIYVMGMEKGELDAALASDEFTSYITALRKYKSGGYYAFGGRDLERFLAWWVEERADAPTS